MRVNTKIYSRCIFATAIVLFGMIAATGDVLELEDGSGGVKKRYELILT